MNTLQCFEISSRVDKVVDHNSILLNFLSQKCLHAQNTPTLLFSVPYDSVSMMGIIMLTDNLIR